MKLNVNPDYNVISDIFMGSNSQQRKKRISHTCGLLTAFMLAGMMCPTSVFAANASSLAASYVSSEYTTDNVQIGSSFRIYLNGENVTEQFEDETAIRVTDEGRTLLPLRALGNLLGADVDWDSANKVAILTINGKTIEVPIGSTMLVVDGTASQIDSEGTQAIIVGDGYTYLPFRAVAEACGATVDYQTGSDGSKNIYLTTSGSTGTVTPTEKPSTITGDQNLAALGIYSATDLGFSATNLPAEGEAYYDSVTSFVNGYRSLGLTDEQINEGLSQIYPCASNGDGSGYVTTEQADHLDTVGKNITTTSHPTYAGDYKYQIVGTWQWSGSDWSSCTNTVAGIIGLGIKL